MATELAEYIAQLVASQPENSDFVLEGDDELRQLKDVLQKQFPDLEQRGITTIDGTETLPDPNQYIWTADGLAAWLKLNWAAIAVTPGVLGASFSVNKSSLGTTQEWLNGTAAVADWSDIEWDVNTSFDLDNNRDVPTEAGIYNYKFSMELDPIQGLGAMAVEFRKTLSGGGTSVVRRSAEVIPDESSAITVRLDALVEMDGVGDYMEVWLDPASGISFKCFNEASRSFFQGLKVSELV